MADDKPVKKSPDESYTVFVAGFPMLSVLTVFLASSVSAWFWGFGLSAIWMLLIVSTMIHGKRKRAARSTPE